MAAADLVKVAARVRVSGRRLCVAVLIAATYPTKPTICHALRIPALRHDTMIQIDTLGSFMIFGWNWFTRFALVGVLLALGACGGSDFADQQPAPAATPSPDVASVQIADDAQGATRPVHVVATYTARIASVATGFFVVGGTCTQAPVPILSLDEARMVVTVRLSGGNCEGGQTLTLTLDPTKATLQNATLANAAIWTRSFDIVPASQKISGSVSSLSGTVVLRNTGGETVTVSSDGLFAFATPVEAGNAYAVTVATQPVGQTCSVSSGNGVVGTSPVDKVVVVCSIDSYQVSGAVSGLTGTVELLNNGGDLLTISANGGFTFPVPLAHGAGYGVTVRTQPVGQTCSVSNGTGSMQGPVANLAVVCAANAYTVGGIVSGLAGTLELVNNGVDVLAISANGTFTFAAPVAFGSTYAVTVRTQPLDEVCAVTNDTGTMGASNVVNVAIWCETTLFSSGNTYNGTLGAGDVFKGPITGLNGSTFNGNAADNDAVTLTTAGTVSINNGTTGGTLSNIKVLNLANGSNTIGFANASSGITTVNGGSGDDALDLANTGNTFLAGTVSLGMGNNSLALESKTYTGAFTAGTGASDTLYVFNGTNISGATVTGFENLVIANNASVTMTQAQYQQFVGSVTAAGTETLNLTTSGLVTAVPSIENYNLADGTNDFTSANVAVSVRGGTGADTFNFAANQIVNFLTSVDGGGGANTLRIGQTATQTIDLVGKVISNIQTIDAEGSTGTAAFTNVNGAGVVLNYTKSTGDNVINLGSGGQTLNLLGSSNANTTIAGGPGVDSISLPISGSGSEIIIATGPNMSNRVNLDSVKNFNATGVDYFKTGTAATTLGSYIIGNADTSNYLATIASGLSIVLNNTGQSYLVSIQTGSASGTYLFQNTGSDTAQFDDTDFFVKLTGATGVISASNMRP